MSSMKFWLSSCIFVLGMSLMANAETQADQKVKGPDRSRPPAVSEPASVQIPAIEKRVLSNGIPVWFIERHTTPLATVAMFVKAGAVNEPADKMGVASLTSDCLNEGTEKYDALQFSEQEDNIGASLSIDQAYFGTTISLTVPYKRLDKGLDLMAQAVMHPTFPQKEIDRLKALDLTGFLQQREDPSSLASCAFLKMIYRNNPTNRQAYTVAGRAEIFSKLTRDDVVKFYKKNYTPKHAFIAVTGGVNVEQAMQQLEAALGSWQEPVLTEAEAAEDMRSSLAKEVPVASKVEGALAKVAGDSTAVDAKVVDGHGKTIYVVDRPGAQQSVIRVGRVGYARDTKFYFPLRVMNTALGGSFMSRLNQNLREKNGYTYGARSTFVFRVEAGPFLVSTDVQTDKTVPALREIMHELEGMQKKLPEAELKRTSDYICYGYPENFETSGKLAKQLLDMQLYNLPDDYYSTYVDNIRKVDAQSMNVPRLTFFAPNNMCMVVAGDAKAIAEQLKNEPGWRMEVLSIDDVMGPEVKP